MKVLNKIKRWLSADDVHSELGGNLLISFFRWSVLVLAIASILIAIVA